MVIIPIKPPQIAKSRLGSTLRQASTAEFAAAFAKDVVAVTAHVANVDRVVAVTSDSSLTRELESSGAHVLSEPVLLTGDLNAVLKFAQGEVLSQHPHCPIAIVTADLATIQPAALVVLLDSARQSEFGYVADHTGSGTSLLINRSGRAVTTEFGPQSASAHRALGFDDLTEFADDSLRLDVDTPDDLERAIVVGLGPAASRLVP
jgi:2-phospho-L-lactate guanylyltransferase